MSDAIESLFEKISSYNLFNYLFTGAVFLVGVDRIAGTNGIGWSITAFVLVAYFMGLVVSRVGSLMIEPLLRKIGLVKYAAYSDFVKAEKADPKIAVLLETNNTYRTLTALFVLLLLIKGAVLLRTKYPLLSGYAEWAWPVALTVLFAISFRKQTKFLHQRVTANLQATQERR